MIAVDTSVIVAGLMAWHESHARSAAVLDRNDVRAPAHCLLETYSVLTRLPPPHRVTPEIASRLLAARFGNVDPLTADGGGHLRLVERLAAGGLGGGAVYDGLVALAAVSAGARLVTRDWRARGVYELVGAEVEMLSD